MYVIKAHSINQYIKTIVVENGNVNTTTTKNRAKAMKFDYVDIADQVMRLLVYTHTWTFTLERIKKGEA